MTEPIKCPRCNKVMSDQEFQNSYCLKCNSDLNAYLDHLLGKKK